MIASNCEHVCSGNCRREGCNCLCGEWHDKYEPDEDEMEKREEIKNDTL